MDGGGGGGGAAAAAAFATVVVGAATPKSWNVDVLAKNEYAVLVGLREDPLFGQRFAGVDLMECGVFVATQEAAGGGGAGGEVKLTGLAKVRGVNNRKITLDDDGQAFVHLRIELPRLPAAGGGGGAAGGAHFGTLLFCCWCAVSGQRWEEMGVSDSTSRSLLPSNRAPSLRCSVWQRVQAVAAEARRAAPSFLG